mgnify:CR=1 FL=1|jgi:hypothetical protein
MDFIRTHLITKIKDQVKEKQNILKFDGFLYLDKDITDGLKKINRLNKWNAYPKEEILPSNWYLLKGVTLLELYAQLKDNNFYIYKTLEGKSHKMRIKKKK